MSKRATLNTKNDLFVRSKTWKGSSKNCSEHHWKSFCNRCVSCHKALQNVRSTSPKDVWWGFLHVARLLTVRKVEGVVEELRCWGLPNPWFTVGKLIITIFTIWDLCWPSLFTANELLWQDPTNMSKIGKAGPNNFTLIGVKESRVYLRSLSQEIWWVWWHKLTRQKLLAKSFKWTCDKNFIQVDLSNH